MKPLICITAGDVAGIGPEIIAKAIQEKSAFLSKVQIVIIGPASVILNEFKKYRPGFKLPIIDKIENAISDVSILDMDDNSALNTLKMGEVSKIAGLLSYRYVLRAIQLALHKQVAAIVTAPINKTSWAKAGVAYGGHTELLAEKSGTSNFAMGFYSKKLKVVLETIHVP